MGEFGELFAERLDLVLDAGFELVERAVAAAAAGLEEGIGHDCLHSWARTSAARFRAGVRTINGTEERARP
ncbi:hypothetical protein GCM10010520_48280 [Rhizobium viscosum]